MRRRTLITGAAAGGIGGITLIGTGAFDAASAERTATVNFADDEDAYLGLVSKSAYATTDGEGELALAFGDVSGDGDGIGRNSQFFFDEVFAIKNQGSETVSITATSDTDSFDGEFRLYPTGDRDGGLDDPDNAVTLETGSEQSVGTYVETGDVDVTNELDIEVAIEAAFEESDEPDDPEPEPPETIDSIEFYSTASQIAADGESELADDSVVAVTASDDAINYDQTGADSLIYEDNPIPLVSVDGASPVAGLGTMQLINDETDFGTGSEEFTLNLMDELIGSGTVLWDESHGQYWTLEDDGNNSFEAFADYAGNNGYSLEATDDFEADLSDAEGVAIGTPADGFTDTELTALSDFVDDGGGLLLLDQSDFGGNEETAALNEIAAELDLDFRFNPDQVEDPEGSFSFTTSEFNTDEFADLFADREGIQ
ncbi:DUF1102 domain-containing protein [Halorubrum tebenquichense]|uniref:Nuclease n=1 Tax=Halorubrum tebenquichense DSM 14210 TaxID=1227485 RepID=M0E201_9EURY|nr:DUF1102 domain-containing protein [Halorubrum tebenquichense]ELZ41825.1 nuclease [Halorubrum tebenquichense DSM 14210]